MLPGVDGGMGHENSEGEITPLLAMLTPPNDPWLLRGLGSAGDGDLGKSADMGDITKLV